MGSKVADEDGGDQFEWDAAKSARCRAQRGFGFDVAARVFESPFLEEQSEQDCVETRLQAIGQVGSLVLFVVWTPRGSRRRIISARQASRKEESDFMATVRRSSKAIQSKPADVDWEKIQATTDADIQRHIQEDGGEEFDFDRARLVIPPAWIRGIRTKYGTQSAFARRFGLSERTIAEWELGRQAPTGPALVLLRVIEHEPDAVERALKAS